MIDVHLIMFSSTAWQEEHTLLQQKHKTQVRPWSSTFKQLLGLRKTTLRVLEFLATTREEKRLEVQDQEQEEQRRSRDEEEGNRGMRSEGSAEGGGEIRGG